MEMGPQSYLLKEDECLWKKELPEIVDTMLRYISLSVVYLKCCILTNEVYVFLLC